MVGRTAVEAGLTVGVGGLTSFVAVGELVSPVEAWGVAVGARDEVDIAQPAHQRMPPSMRALAISEKQA